MVDYLSDIYNFVTKQDPTFSGDVDIEKFKSDMQNDSYAKEIYKYLSSVDSSFSGDVDETSFLNAVKKKDFFQDSTSDLETGVSESLENVQNQTAETPKSKNGLTGDVVTDVKNEVLNTFSKIAKNIENAYDNSFPAAILRSLGASQNPALRAINVAKKIEAISSDKSLSEQERKEKIENISGFNAVWAPEPFINITDYSPDETNEIAVSVMSTILDFAAVPSDFGASSAILKAARLNPKTFLGVGKLTQDALKGIGFEKKVAEKIVKKSLPEFVKRVDETATQFGIFGVAKDFQNQMSETDGIEGVDFSQSADAFADNYDLGALLGASGSLARSLPKAFTAGKANIQQKGLSKALEERGLNNSVILGTLGETLAASSEIGTFGVINAYVPTEKNPEGELTYESLKDGIFDATKFILGLRGAGKLQKILSGEPLIEPKITQFNKAEKEYLGKIAVEFKQRQLRGKISEKDYVEYIESIIKNKRAPITLVEKIVQEIGGLKSNSKRIDILKKVARIELEPGPSGENQFIINTFDSKNRWLTTTSVENPSQAREVINNFEKSKKSSPNEFEPKVEIRLNFDETPEPKETTPTKEAEPKDTRLVFFRAGITKPEDLDPEQSKDPTKAVYLSEDRSFVEQWDKNKKYGDGDIKRIKVDIKNPFDFDDPNTWKAAIDNKIFTRKELEQFKNREKVEILTDPTIPETATNVDLSKNNHLLIEQKGEQLKQAGYDSFYVLENGSRNIGVFNKGVFEEFPETQAQTPSVVEPTPPERLSDVLQSETGVDSDIPTYLFPSIEASKAIKRLEESKIKEEKLKPVSEELLKEGFVDTSILSRIINSAGAISRKVKSLFTASGVLPRKAFLQKELVEGGLDKTLADVNIDNNELMRLRSKKENLKYTDDDLNAYLKAFEYFPSVSGVKKSAQAGLDDLVSGDVTYTKVFASEKFRDEFLKKEADLRGVSVEDLNVEFTTNKDGSEYYTTLTAKKLPEDIRNLLAKMRFDIDNLSIELIKTGVIKNEELKVKTSLELGSYLHRSYDLFNESTLRTYEQIRKENPNLFTLVSNRLQREIEKEVRQESPELSGDELYYKVKPKVEERMKQILSNKKSSELKNLVDSFKSFSSNLKGTNLESDKNFTPLQKRTDIPKVIRMYMGEFTAPEITVGVTKRALSHLLYNHKFQENLKQNFSGTLFFENPEDVPKAMRTNIDGTVSASIQLGGREQRENSDFNNPLDGLWTSPEIAKTLSFDNNKPYKFFLSRVLSLATYVHKTSSTLLNYPGHMLNLFSNVGYLYSNGVIGHLLAKPKSAQKIFFDSIKLGLVDVAKLKIGGRERVAIKPEGGFKNDYLEYIELGIIGTSTTQKDLLSYVKDAGILLSDPATYAASKSKQSKHLLANFFDIAKRTGKGGLDAIGRLWAAEDDFFKIIAYKVALERRLETYTDMGMSTMDAKIKIADEVKREMPTYNRLPAAYKNIRGTKIIGPWLTYPIISTYSAAGNIINSANHMSLGTKLAKEAINDYKQGNKKDGKRKAKQAKNLFADGTKFMLLGSTFAALGYLAVDGEEDFESQEQKANRESLLDAVGAFKRTFENLDAIKVSEAYGLRDKKGKLTGAKVTYRNLSGYFIYNAPYNAINGIVNSPLINRFSEIEQFETREKSPQVQRETTNFFSRALEKPYLDIAEDFGIALNPVVSAIYEATTGKDVFGRDIYDVEDGASNRIFKGLNHIIRTKLTPLSFNSIRKLIEADEISPVAISQFTGLKMRTFNPIEQFGFKVSDYKEKYIRTYSQVKSDYYKIQRLKRRDDEDDNELDERKRLLFRKEVIEKLNYIQDETSKLNRVYNAALKILITDEQGRSDFNSKKVKEAKDFLIKRMKKYGDKTLLNENLIRGVVENKFMEILLVKKFVEKKLSEDEGNFLAGENIDKEYFILSDEIDKLTFDDFGLEYNLLPLDKK